MLLARLRLIPLLALMTISLPAQEKSTPPHPIDQAWEAAWNRFYLPKVQTFADYLSSYEPGKEQAHLPTAEEVRALRTWDPQGFFLRA